MNKTRLRSIVPEILNHINVYQSEKDLLNACSTSLLKLDSIDMVGFYITTSKENHFYQTSNLEDIEIKCNEIAQFIDEFSMGSMIFYNAKTKSTMKRFSFIDQYSSIALIPLSDGAGKFGYVIFFSKANEIPYMNQEQAWSLVIKTIILGLKKMTDKKTEENALIDAYQRLEKVSERNKLLETHQTLAKGLIHDINNMVAVIQGYSELLKMELEDETDSLDSVNEIYIASQRAKNLISQFDDFIKSSTTTQKFYITSILKEIIKKYRRILTTGVISYNFSDETLQVITNPLVFEEIFSAISHFVTNINLNEPKIQVNVQESGQSDTHNIELSFVVKSDSILKFNNLPNVFNAFFANKAKGLLENADCIFTDSELDNDKLHIRLSFRNKVQNKISKVKLGNNILLVDDEIALTKLGKKIITSLGYKVKVTNESKKALEILDADANDFGLVIVDQRMPKMTGLELAEKIFINFPNLPVVMYTGYSDISRLEALNRGISEYLEKPVSKETFSRVLGKYLN